MTTPAKASSTLAKVTFTELAPYGSFKQTCSNAGVCKAWRTLSENSLQDCLNFLRGEGEVLANYDLGSNAEKNRQYQFPAAIETVSDLKKRFARVLRHAPAFRAFEDIPSAVMIARSAKIFNIQDRTWVALYTTHVPIFTVNILAVLKNLAVKEEIALGLEGIERTIGKKTVTHYLFALEEPLSKKLAVLLEQQMVYFDWLSLTENGTDFETNAFLIQGPERHLFSDLLFPFFLFQKEEIEKLSFEAQFKWAACSSNQGMQSMLNTYNVHCSNGTMTPALKQSLSRQLMIQHKDALLTLIQIMATDITEQSGKNQSLTAEEKQKVLKFLSLPPGNEKDELYESFIRPKLILDLRNKMWKQSVQMALPSIPKGVPHVLFAGRYHVTTAMNLINSTNAPASSDKKENKKNNNT